MFLSIIYYSLVFLLYSFFSFFNKLNQSKKKSELNFCTIILLKRTWENIFTRNNRIERIENSLTSNFSPLKKATVVILLLASCFFVLASSFWYLKWKQLTTFRNNTEKNTFIIISHSDKHFICKQNFLTKECHLNIY